MGFLTHRARWGPIQGAFGYTFKSLASAVFVGFVVVLALGSAVMLLAQPRQGAGRQNDAARANARGGAAPGGEVELLHVQGNVSMLAGAGGNITVQTGNDGILLVDSGSAAMGEKVMEALRRMSKGQVTYIINTDDRSDHIGGNELFATSGRALAINRAAQASVFIVAYDTILDRMSAPSGQATAVPEKAWPNDPYSAPTKTLFFNGEGIEIDHQPGTTDGNSIVFFRRSDVISTGDIFDITEYPIIDLKAGGSLQAIIDGLNRLKVMAIPGNHQEGGTLIIPGHGRICDEADLALYQEMVTIVRDRLQDMIKKGMTLEQIKAAKPTQDFDPIYGKNDGNWTTDMFLEAAYKSLTSKADAHASGK